MNERLNSQGEDTSAFQPHGKLYRLSRAPLGVRKGNAYQQLMALY